MRTTTSTAIIYSDFRSINILFLLFFWTFVGLSSLSAQEICGNGVDDDNNGFVDEYCAVPAITCSSGSTAPDLNVPSGTPFIFNTYYPAPSGGETTVSEGSTSIPVDAGAVLGNDPIMQGDLVLIIQMQGATLNIGDQDELDTPGGNGDYGDGDGGKDRQGILTSEFTAGIYEFAFASNGVTGGVVDIVSPLRNTYSNSDNITGGLGIRRYQVVRIPRYNNLNVPAGATLTGSPWDGRRGGIVAAEVIGTMTINGIINMTGRGFRGGHRFSDTEFGYKGEGLAGRPPYVYSQVAGGLAGSSGYPGTALGLGAAGNAGGGPREVDSGGGGGAGAGDGGDGGVGPFGSTDPRNNAPYQAKGGAGIADAGDRLILGGGGGGGNADNAGFTEVAASGGAGGGIIILRANTVVGNGFIRANGEGGETQPQEGAGGGGGGGSILIYSNSTNLNTLIIEAQGGEGHSTQLHTGGGDGGGGGGGGGRVLLMHPAGNPVSAIASVSGGPAGRGGRWFFSGGSDTHEDGLNGAPGFVAEVPPPPPFSCPEECGDGIDNDGDGLIDDLDPDCPAYTPSEPSCDDPLITYYMPTVWKNTNRGRPQALIISTEFAQANVSIETADGVSFVRNVNVVVGTPVFVNLPNDIVESNNIASVERNKGLIIRSDFPINAAYLVNNNSNKVILSIKGTASLGKAFRVVSPTRISNGNAAERQFVSVMASEDNTQITFSDSPFALQGVTLPLSITLNRGETYMLKTQEGSGAQLQGPLGMLITSDKPITINTGCQHMQAAGTTSKEGGMDQAIPFERLGTEYVCIRGGINAVQDYVIVMGVENNTNIFLDGNPNPIAKIDAGTAFEVSITGNLGDPHHIRANKPIYAYHVSGLGGGGEFGMSILPPVNPYGCVGSKYSEFLKFPGITNHAYAIVPNSGLASLRLNGNQYTALATANPVPGLTDYSVVNFENNDLLNGINVIQSSEALHLGLLVGNSGDGGTYGFFTEYQAKVKALDPDILLPTEYYLVDTVCAEEELTHTLLVESCDPFHEIIGVEGAVGTVDFQAGSLTLTYTAPSDSMLDIFKVRFRNGLGLTGQVCLGIYVAPKPEPTISPDTTICEGESTPLLATGGISYS
ncbi:MAG: IgGFc-binding protein, partial [Bacteroidota bacterium]